VTVTDITDATKTLNVSSSISVTAGAAAKLTIQTQPSPSATAGFSFAQQPVIRVEDANGNLVTADNGRVITVARSAGTGALQGTLNVTTVNGVATFANLSHNVANTITLNFTATGLTGATSANIVVGPATASQLVFATQPSGTRTGSPLATQPVVKAQDAYGNTSSVGFPANLNVSLALTAGSGSLLGTTTLDIGTAAGNGTATFTTVECSDAGTNKQITASAAGFTDAISSLFTLYGVERATGGTAIPSSTAGGAYTTLTGPVYYEYATGDVGTGTIILNAPIGFVFDTSGTAPTVRIDRLAGSGNDNRNINGVATGTSAAITSRTATQITFTASGASSLGVTCSLTWQNVRVRPTAASPLSSGNITKTGTSVMAVVTNSSTSFGRLIEIEPAASGLSKATSSVFTVAKANQTVSFGALVARTYGEAPFTVGASASSGLPVSFSIVSGPATISGNSVTITGAGTVTVRASQSGDANWNAATSVDQSFAVAKKTVTGSITANSKTYDGTTAATIASRTLSGVIGADNLSLSGGTATFADRTAGNGKSVTATGLSLSGTAAGNYQLASTSAATSADITARSLTVSATGENKVYDGTTAATVTLLDDRIENDVLTVSYTKASFADNNVQNGKPVSVSGISVSGTDAGNYTANTEASTVADITGASLSVVGITAANKVYDGTTVATLNLDGANVIGVVSGDDVTVDANGVAGAFSDAEVGTGKLVTVSGLTLIGADAGKYTLTQPTTTADITPAQ